MITPSSFNIFRDSLRDASKEMERRLIDNLPDMNLDDISSGTSSEGESELVPLDFRTAVAGMDGGIMIQAKPMQFKSIEEDQIDPELAEAVEEIKKGGKPSMPKIYNVPLTEEDEFFKRVVRKPFHEDDEDVVLIHPGIDAGAIFGSVDLPCSTAIRKNNKVDAEVISEERPVSSGWQAPARHTAFDSPRGGEPLLSKRKSVKEAQRMVRSGNQQETNKPKVKKNLYGNQVLKGKQYEDDDDMPARDVDTGMLQFDNILTSMGVGSNFNFDDLSDCDDEEEVSID